MALPQTIKMYEGITLKSTAEIDDGMKTIEEVVSHTEGTFDALRMMRAIHMFEPTKVSFIEKEDDA